MNRGLIHRGLYVLVLASLCLFLWGASLVGQDVDTDGLRVTRSISTAYALPQSHFMVTLHLETGQDLVELGVQELLPIGWEIHPLENAGAAFKRAGTQWVFEETIRAGRHLEIVYEVTVPEADRLMTGPLPRCFSITGTLQTKLPALGMAVMGDSEIQVVSALPIMSAIAHLVPQKAPEKPDTIDLRLGQTITREQYTRALELWQGDIAVPWTHGERLDLALIERVAAYYVTCTPVDEPLPLSLDPELNARRTISTFLPYDTVLLANGCLDPGIQARRFVVSVEITGSNDAYGVGLKEWFPVGWRVTPISNDGFWYRSSQVEWIYPKRLAAGETKRIVYQVEVVPSFPNDFDDPTTCCGEDATVVGMVSSELGCCEREVTGENTVHIWRCLPVILAISRWDVANDRLDVTLSDRISFLQVQRALAFWLRSAPVPHTCGYTVGYETLKAIVAYWLTNTPVTDALPATSTERCKEEAGIVCYEPPSSYGWFCQMKDSQLATDFVGAPPVTPAVVNAGLDQVLTCDIPVVTLTATATGGPYTYEWVDVSGRVVGVTGTITIDEPGTYTVTARRANGCSASDSVVVTQDITPPTVDVGPDQLLDCNITSVLLDATVSGGTPPYTYMWTDPGGTVVGNTEDITVSSPDTYTLTATGANGCLASDSVVVTQDIVPPTVDAGPDQQLTCVVTSVLLDATMNGGTPPYTYTWTDSGGTVIGNTEDITVSLPDTYTLTVTGTNGCLASDSVVVTQNTTLPTIDAGPDQVLDCNITSVLLDATVNGGTPPYTYTWTDSGGTVVGNTEDITVSSPDTYTLTATGVNGCAASDSVVVTQNTTLPTIDAGPDQVLDCNITSVLLDATVNGGTPPYTYTWTDSGGTVVGNTEDITVSSPDTYTLTVTGTNGCLASDSVVVTQNITPPTVDAGPDQQLTCVVTSVLLDATVNGGTPPYTYTWTDSGGTVVGNTEDITVSSPDTYTLTVTGTNGCLASDSVVVTQNITPPTVDAGPDQQLTCVVTSVLLDATVSDGTPPYTYTWTNSGGTVVGNTEDITVSLPDTYTLTVTGTNGCLASDSVVVTQDITPPTVDAGPDQVLDCNITSVLLDATVSDGTPPYRYKWTSSTGTVIGTGEDIIVDEQGTYTLMTTGTNGCSARDSVVVTQDITPPTVDAGPDQVLDCNITSVLLGATVSGGTPPYTYTWTDSGGTVVGIAEDITVFSPDTYTLTATGVNGCSASDSVVVTQDIAPPTVDAGPDQVLDCNITSVLLDATMNGGTPPYTYTWTNSSGIVIGYSEDIAVSSPDTYTLTATGTNCCSASDSVVVTQDIVPPTVNTGPDQQLTCVVTSVLLDSTVSGGTPPYTYTWTDSGGMVVGMAEDITVFSPDTYTLTATGINGCSASGSVTVTQDIASLTIDAGPDQVLDCNITSVLLDATVSGGTPPYTYMWTDPGGTVVGNTEDITVSSPDTYTLTATGVNGCSARDSVVVTQDIVPPTVDAGPDQVLDCNITSVLLGATVNGGTPPYTYTWTDSGGMVVGIAEDITVFSPDTYTLTATGVNDCSARDSVVVTQDIVPPTVDAGPDQVLDCNITSVLLDATMNGGTPPYTYTWTNSSGIVIGYSEDIAVSSPDTYTLTATGTNCCSASDSVVVTQDIVPPTVNTGPDQQLTCVVTSVLLDSTVSGGTPPYTYTWTDSGGMVVGMAEDITVFSPDTYTLTATGVNGCLARDSVVVTQDIVPPTVNTGPDQQLTCAVTSVLLNATVSGGTPPYTYTWTDSGGMVVGMAEDITVFSPDTYTLTATGVNGCSARDSVVVTQDIVPPTVDAGPDQVLDCNITSVLLNATVSGGTPPYTYTWTDSGGMVVGIAEDITVFSPDTYTLTATGVNDCSARDSVVVTQDIAPPTVDAGPDQVLDCNITSVLLDATVNGGTPPYTYTWTNSSGIVMGYSEDIAVSSPDTYTLTATGTNYCSASDSVVVTQDIVPPTVNTGPDQQLTCAVTSVLLNATVSGGTPPYTYTWTDSGGIVMGYSEDIAVSSPDTYTLTATGTNCCSASDSVVVTQDIVPPTVNTGPDQQLTCAVTSVLLNATVSGGTPPYTYTWTNSGGIVMGYSEDIAVSSPDTYTLTATGTNGCSARDSVVVTQDIAPPMVNAGPDQQITCAVTSVLLDATVSGGTPPYTYTWTDSGGMVVGMAEDITVFSPDTYTLTATGVNGCSARDSVVVTQNITPPTVDAGPDQVLDCNITSVLLDATVSGGIPPHTYTWTNSGGMMVGMAEDITVFSPDTYTLIATGANGCSASGSVAVTEDIASPTVNITPNGGVLTCTATAIELAADTSASLCGVTSYQWHKDGFLISGAISSTYTVTQTGSYKVVVKCVNGCKDTDAVTVTEDIEPPIVDAGPDQELTCITAAVTLSANVCAGKPPYAYVWQDETGKTIACTKLIVVSEPGVYRVTVVGENGCCAGDEVAVTEDIEPPCVEVGPDKLLTCTNPEIHIDATICGGTPPYEIWWTNDCGETIATTEDIIVTLPGSYTITVIGANECSTSNTVTVVNGIDPPEVNAGPDKVLTCEIKAVLLDATVIGGAFPYQYKWMNACGTVIGETEDIVVTLPSVYTLTVTTAEGCIASDSVEVTQE